MKAIFVWFSNRIRVLSVLEFAVKGYDGFVKMLGQMLSGQEDGSDGLEMAERLNVVCFLYG